MRLDNSKTAFEIILGNIKGIKKKEESFRANFSVYATKTADWQYFIEQIL